MKLILIDISWSATSLVSPDARVATRLGLETLEYRSLFTVSIWRYSKISYSRIIMDNAWEKSDLPTGNEKTRSKQTKGERFLKTNTRRVRALYLVFSFNGAINSLHQQHERLLLATISLKWSNDS